MTPRIEGDDLFSACESAAELLYIADATVGRDFALVLARIDANRTHLTQTAREIRRAGALDLAKAVQAIAKASPPDPRPLWQRSRKPGVWHTASAQVVIERRRAERWASVPCKNQD
jgi:hypothetical protein